MANNSRLYFEGIEYEIASDGSVGVVPQGFYRGPAISAVVRDQALVARIKAEAERRAAARARREAKNGAR